MDRRHGPPSTLASTGNARSCSDCLRKCRRDTAESARTAEESFAMTILDQWLPDCLRRASHEAGWRPRHRWKPVTRIRRPPIRSVPSRKPTGPVHGRGPKRREWPSTTATQTLRISCRRCLWMRLSEGSSLDLCSTILCRWTWGRMCVQEQD